MILTTLCIVLATLWISGSFLCIWGIAKAPRGYEDENGFHFGREPWTGENAPGQSLEAREEYSGAKSDWAKAYAA